jgi:hypothetical protein
VPVFSRQLSPACLNFFFEFHFAVMNIDSHGKGHVFVNNVASKNEEER